MAKEGDESLSDLRAEFVETKDPGAGVQPEPKAPPRRPGRPRGGAPIPIRSKQKAEAPQVTVALDVGMVEAIQRDICLKLAAMPGDLLALDPDLRPAASEVEMIAGIIEKIIEKRFGKVSVNLPPELALFLMLGVTYAPRGLAMRARRRDAALGQKHAGSSPSGPAPGPSAPGSGSEPGMDGGLSDAGGLGRRPDGGHEDDVSDLDSLGG